MSQEEGSDVTVQLRGSVLYSQKKRIRCDSIASGERTVQLSDSTTPRERISYSSSEPASMVYL